MAAVLDTTSYTFTQFERLVPLTSVRPPAGVFNATFADHGFSNLRTCTAVPGTAFDLTFNLTGARRLIFKGGLSASVPLSMWWWDIRTAGKRGLVTIRTDGGEQRVVPVLELGISSVEIDQELRADGGAAPAYEGFIDATGVWRGKTEVSGYGLVEIVVLGVFDY
ncbi:uncharacterized protein LTHEOB_5287 [Lasiodiplodia theobromae]|uniref:Uncharacterized protein n=1 Tax=Lasiodiplodia theobromae TaxID=45133 RepID=A0A5N5CVX9_9PEZI|nr:uncharacterized protein LTHEOB_5287 [Lasiodiplodia theobromae]KAB2569494.1 hypothetical protein DBV05_g11833 [Lasiodiplodia theobromae]KAF4545454.1 hypothetical protein LTHEOB_5287 [Lasiodiplodia theobromae]